MADLSAYDIGLLTVDSLAQITNPFPGESWAFDRATNNVYKCTAGAVPGPIVWVALGAGGIYVLTSSVKGILESGEIIIPNLPVTDAFTIPAGGTGSRGRVGIAPTSTATFTLYRNGSSFGTMQFAAAALTATFTIASDVNFVAGDYWKYTCPSPADVTLSDLGIALRGVR